MRGIQGLMVACVAGLCAWSSVAAAQGECGLKKGEGFVLEGARIHVGDGSTVIEAGAVAFDAQGRITAVGAGAAGPGMVIDVTGKVITPGLVDFVTQLGLVEVEAVKGTVDTDSGGDRVRAAFRAWEGFNPNSLSIPVQRAGGVTSALIVPTGGLVSGQSAWINLSGERGFGAVIQSPVAMHMSFGEEGSAAAGGSRGGALLALRELYDDVRFYQSNKSRYDGNQSRSLADSRLDLEALATTLAGKLPEGKLPEGKPLVGKLPVAVRVHRAVDILRVLEFCREQGLSPILIGATEAWIVRRELAAAGVPVVIDPMSNTPSSFERLGEREDNARLLHEAGVPVILSTFSTHNARALRFQAGNAVRAGLPFEAALRAVTLAPAQAAGVADRYGSLEVGKRASLAVWSGDPFEFSSKVERLFIDGVEVSLDNRQRRLMERYRALPRRGKPASFDEVDELR